MAGPGSGGGAPPGIRRQLAEALAQGALSPDTKLIAVPLEYAIWRLAIRTGIPPWELVSDDPERTAWLFRGLIFRQLEDEAATKTKKGVRDRA